MRTLSALLLIAGVVLSCARVLALPDDARVPVLTYHSWDIRHDPETGTCDVESEALARDLDIIYNAGFTVIPAYWLAQWVRGERDGATLPPRAVVITIDDGHDADYLDNIWPYHPCAPIRSIRSVLEDAAAWDWGGPEGMPVPHASLFVIGSPAARELIDAGGSRDGGWMNDNWWSSAHYHPLLEVYNHSLDHDHNAIPADTYDEHIEVELTAGGGQGQMTSRRIDTHAKNDLYVALAAEYITARIGMWPDLFAYPFGPASTYAVQDYFPRYAHEHGTVAAFCTDGGANRYVTLQSDPFCLPRFVHRSSPAFGGWRDADELRAILRAAGR